jgi:hypothetical protein
MNAVRLSALVLAAAPLLVSAPAEAGDGTPFLSLIPSNAELVVGIDVDALRSTSVFTRVMSTMEASGDFQSVMTQLRSSSSFDPARDVHTVIITAPEVGEDSGDDPVIIIDATFDSGELAAALAGVADMSATDLGMVQMWTRGSETLAAVGENTLVFGRTSSLQTLLAGGTPGPGSRLSAQISDANRGQEVWFASLSPEGEEQILGMHGSIDLSLGVAASVTLSFESAERASAEATRLATARTELLADPALAMFGLTNVVNSITSVANGDKLDLSVSVDAGTWNTLLTTFLAIAESELQ